LVVPGRCSHYLYPLGFVCPRSLGFQWGQIDYTFVQFYETKELGEVKLYIDCILLCVGYKNESFGCTTLYCLYGMTSFVKRTSTPILQCDDATDAEVLLGVLHGSSAMDAGTFETEKNWRDRAALDVADCALLFPTALLLLFLIRAGKSDLFLPVKRIPDEKKPRLMTLVLSLGLLLLFFCFPAVALLDDASI
jgi:hypothetical protein